MTLGLGSALAASAIAAGCEIDSHTQAPDKGLVASARQQMYTDAVPGACSQNCAFAPGGGMPAGAPAGTSLANVQGCALNGGVPSGVNKQVGTSNIVTCLVNLACHLGRSPTKIEALQALGVGASSSMLGVNAMCSPSSQSGQPIPNATSDTPEGMRALRCVTTPFFQGAAWCSFTTLPNDDTIECVNMDFTSAPNFTCGTDPVGIHLNDLCGKIDDATVVPPGGSVFDALVQVGGDGGQDSCNVCHEETVGKKANPNKPCYNFPGAGAQLACPLTGLSPACSEEWDTPLCIDGSQPSCPSQTTLTSNKPTCADGSTPMCFVTEQQAICKLDPGIFATQQTLPRSLADGFCDLLKQLVANAARQADAGPPPEWADMTFVQAYIDSFCPPTAPDPRPVEDGGVDGSVTDGGGMGGGGGPMGVGGAGGSPMSTGGGPMGVGGAGGSPMSTGGGPMGVGGAGGSPMSTGGGPIW
jgi:hypothetical protein